MWIKKSHWKEAYGELEKPSRTYGVLVSHQVLVPTNRVNSNKDLISLHLTALILTVKPDILRELYHGKILSCIISYDSSLETGLQTML